MAIRIVFSDRAMVALTVETLEKFQTETGGVFLGYRRGKTWYVIETIDPGPNAVFQRAYFEYDQAYINHLINKISRLYEEQLDLIGLWHRHPGSFDRFSETDDITNTQYAELSEYGAVSLLVNIDPTFRITAYHVSLPLRYDKISYEVGDHLIPDNLLKLKSREKVTERINDVFESNHRNTQTVYQLSKKDHYARFVTAHLTEALTSYLETHNVPVLNHKIGGLDLDKTDGLDAVLATLQEDLDYFEKNGIVVQLSINENQQLALVTNNANEKAFHLTFSIVNTIPVFVFNDKAYVYQAGLIKTGLSEYVTKEADSNDQFNTTKTKRRFFPNRNQE